VSRKGNKRPKSVRKKVEEAIREDKILGKKFE